MFVPTPVLRDFGVINKPLMQNTGIATLNQIDLDKIEAYSLHVETFASKCVVKKVTLRAILVSDKG